MLIHKENYVQLMAKNIAVVPKIAGKITLEKILYIGVEYEAPRNHF